MKEKLKNIQTNLKNNPEFQAKLQEMKPKRNLWGFLGVMLFFFVPEFLNYFYDQEINAWMAEMARLNYSPEMAEKIVWITQQIFDGELSYFNIGLGIAFLVWMFRK